MSPQPGTPPTPVDEATVAGAGPPPGGASIGAAIPEPSAVGVPKFQTVGGHFVFVGTKYKRVILAGDGNYYALDPLGNILTDPVTGKQVTDTPKADRSGNPIKVQAQYQAPTGAPVDTPNMGGYPVTSRIQPGSPAAQAGTFGPARYDEGQEGAIFWGMPAEQRVQVQQAMIDKGLNPSSALTPGGLDQSWVTAFKTVLGYANANNLTWVDALQSMPDIDRTQVATVQRNHYNVQLTSPQDLAAVFRQAMGRTIGGGQVPEADVQQYVRAFQQVQLEDAQKRAEQANAAAFEPKRKVAVDAAGNVIGEPAGTDVTSLPDSAAGAVPTSGLPGPALDVTTAPPSPEAFAQDYIKTHFANRVNQTSYASAYNLFLNSLGMSGPSTASAGVT